MNTASTVPRRAVLRRIGIGLAGVAAIGAGFIGWAVQRPAPTLVSTRCAGGSPMNRKVLVAYASRAGSTGEVAQAIAERLCAQGFDAEVRPVANVASLDSFQAVVLGSAIRYGAWLPEMMKFAQAQRAALAALPVATFTVHMQALDDSMASRHTRSGYGQAVRALVAPRDEAFFAGKVDPATLTFFERLAVKMVRSPLGDKRDWPRIRSWADGLGAKLQ
ncbi:MAG: flavodoxin domain-containing protein [Rubrivivax sp.]|nr:flavodoxin domain-containing protein [Rubrivivax sp.]